MNTDMTMLARKLQGKFVVFDGPDGAGKSEQHKLLAKKLEIAGVSFVSCHDPGGTKFGDRIRSVLLDYDLSTMDAACETMLFMASRAQLVSEVIKPALAADNTVLCDRFVTSTCAYQGAAGYDPKVIVELARLAIGNTWPEVTVILDVDPEVGLERINRKRHHVGKNRKRVAGQSTLFDDGVPDAMESRPIEFHRRVRRMFLEVHEYYPTPVITIDGRGDRSAVFDRIVEGLARVFG